MSTYYWTGYAGFHAAKKAAREAGQPEPTRLEHVQNMHRFDHNPAVGKMVPKAAVPLLTCIQQAI